VVPFSATLKILTISFRMVRIMLKPFNIYLAAF